MQSWHETTSFCFAQQQQARALHSNNMRSLILSIFVAVTTSFAPVMSPKPASTLVRSEPPKTSTPPINRATALSGGLLGGYLLLELGYGAYNSTKE